MKQAYHIRVEGRVQGVNYRSNTRREALKLGLAGKVMNLPDGAVWIEAEGAESALQELLTWCKSGPALARVTRVDATAVEVKGFTDFVIAYPGSGS